MKKIVLLSRWVSIDKNIVSALEQLIKRNEGQVRPMDRSPSVPIHYLYACSSNDGTNVLLKRPLLLIVSSPDA